MILAVTAEGGVYVGVTPVNFAALPEKLKTELATRKEKRLYVKADARTLYSNVLQVLRALRTTGIRKLALLTSQRVPVKPGALVPPVGLEVLIVPPPPSTEAAVVQLQGTTLKVNNETVPGAALANKLKQFFQNRADKVVSVKAEPSLQYADVVDVIDTCRSTGAAIVLAQ
ncbi:MAG: biopolymer transporter ExbD [Acidobacteria bacterium]|nr:biopolymer transporter ExbD [Acidobacteriota bacterium]